MPTFVTVSSVVSEFDFAIIHYCSVRSNGFIFEEKLRFVTIIFRFQRATLFWFARGRRWASKHLLSA